MVNDVFFFYLSAVTFWNNKNTYLVLRGIKSKIPILSSFHKRNEKQKKDLKAGNFAQNQFVTKLILFSGVTQKRIAADNLIFHLNLIH